MALEKKFFFLENDRNKNLLPVRRLNIFYFVTQSGQNSPKHKTAVFMLFWVVFGSFGPFCILKQCLMTLC